MNHLSENGDDFFENDRSGRHHDHVQQIVFLRVTRWSQSDTPGATEPIFNLPGADSTVRLGYSGESTAKQRAMPDSRTVLVLVIFAIAVALILWIFATNRQQPGQRHAPAGRGGDTPRLWIEMVPADRN